MSMILLSAQNAEILMNPVLVVGSSSAGHT